MKKFLIPFVAVAALIFTGCASPKKIAYLQHAEDYTYDETRYQHNIKVMPKDNSNWEDVMKKDWEQKK